MKRQPKGRSYLESDIRSASPPRLLLMLYEGAIRFCRQGIEAQSRGDRDAKHTAFCRAQDILMELLGALDKSVAPELSGRLSALYVYLHKRLIEGNIKEQPGAAEEVIRHLEVLLGAWREACLALDDEPGRSRTGQEPVGVEVRG
ncbi:MAG: flagellar export chaperone FliS [Planctomycetes bacterium]|nr:flagellar export chaperone FliS [Planctomycetota bacterium]